MAVLTDAVRQNGHAVLTARGSPQALAGWQPEQPDVVLW